MGAPWRFVGVACDGEAAAFTGVSSLLWLKAAFRQGVPTARLVGFFTRFRHDAAACQAALDR
jgi:hypothetical protein